MTLYVAYKVYPTYENVFCFSDDIFTFFDYLRNYFSLDHSIQLRLSKLHDLEEIAKIIAEYDAYELVEFSQNVWVRAFECSYIENYLIGFYDKVKDSINGTRTGVMCYQQFLRFLGSHKLREIVNGIGDFDALYALDKEYREKINEDT